MAFEGCVDFIIYGSKDSYAQTYAEENKIPFEYIGKNEITVSEKNVVAGYSSKAQSILLDAEALGGSLTYSSSNKKVKVSKNGKVTLPAKFTGSVTITIQTSGDDEYTEASEKVTIKVPKTPARFINLTQGKTYYFKIRTYTTKGEDDHVSAWSGAKSAKVK